MRAFLPRTALVIVVTAGCAGGRTQPASRPETRVETVAFSVPQPAGFAPLHHESVEEVWRSGGLVLAARERPAFPGAFLASIVVTPVPGQTEGITTMDLCRSTAQLLVEQMGADIKDVRLANVGGAPTCQWDLVARDPTTRGAMGTVMSEGRGTWVLTCNLDTRDEGARAACAAVLAGWKFKKATI